jgi:hypothetical protein
MAKTRAYYSHITLGQKFLINITVCQTLTYLTDHTHKVGHKKKFLLALQNFQATNTFPIIFPADCDEKKTFDSFDTTSSGFSASERKKKLLN